MQKGKDVSDGVENRNNISVNTDRRIVMCDWGPSFEYHNCTFVPHFEAGNDDLPLRIIDGFVCVNFKYRNTEDVLRLLLDKYVGVPYWIFENNIKIGG